MSADGTAPIDDPTEPIVLGPGVELPADLAARVKAELEPGERLLWAAKAVRPAAPKGGSLRTATLWLMGLCLVLAGGIATTAGLFGPIDESLRPLVGVLSVITGIGAIPTAIGVLVAASNRFADRSHASGLTYALTDRRAITWKPRPGTRATEVFTRQARTIAGIHRVEFPDGTGDVVFEQEPAWNEAGFLGIAEVRRVEALARTVLVDPELAKPRRRDDHSVDH